MGEPLVWIPNATVYEVARSTNTVAAIANGDFIIAYSSIGGDAGLEAKVACVRWSLDRWVAALRFDNHTYAFQLPSSAGAANTGAHARSTGRGADTASAASAAVQQPSAAAGHHALDVCYYYCLKLQPDTSLELIDLLQAVLASGTAYQDYQHVQQQQQPQGRQGQPAEQRAGGPPPAAAGAQGSTSAAERPEGPMPRAAATGGGPQPAVGLPGAPAASSSGSSKSADRIAVGLQVGGQLAAAGVLKAATWAGKALQRGADVAVARMQASDQQPALSPQMLARLERAKSGAAQVAEASGRAVAGAISITATVAEQLAQSIADSNLGRKIGGSKLAGASAQDLRKVGLAGVEAVEAVYDSLADAARIVLAHTQVAATRVACHKYGPGAAQATGASMQLMQSAVETGLKVAKLRPTMLVKTALKGTTKNVVLCAGNQLQTLEQQDPRPRPPHGPQLQQQSQQGNHPVPFPAEVLAGVTATAPMLPLAGSDASTSNAPAPPPSPWVHAPAPMAVVSTHGPHVGPQAFDFGMAICGAGGDVASTIGTVVDGVPLMGQPVMPAYTPSTSVPQHATILATGTPLGSGQELPYPAVSGSQYNAQYYPAIPR